MKRQGRLGCLLAAFVALSASAADAAEAGDWLRFRGPNGSGAASDERLPIDLSPATAAWARSTPFGQSSPVVARGLVFMTAFILGVDPATGKSLWERRREVPAESWTTPVVHRAGADDSLVLTFGTAAVDAYDPRTGERAWTLPGFGATPVASPVVDGDAAFVVVPDQAAEFAVPPTSTFEPLDTGGDGALDAQEIASSDWAGTFPWFDVDGDGKATFAEIDRQLGVMRSPDDGLVAVDLPTAGGPKVRWRERRTLPYIATPIVYRGVLFLVKDGGILTSYDPSSGAVLKRGRIEGAVEPFFPSPVAAGGRLYLTSSTGTVAVVTAEAQWDTLAVNDLDEETFASPAIAEGRLFVRTRSKLYAFGAKQ